METEMKGKYLPIGTVVMLKEAKTPVMITSYCVFPNKNKANIYDYGACPYPQGMLKPDVIHAFNHSQIDKILFMGYETDNSKKLSDLLSKGIDNYKSQVVKESQQPNHPDNQ